MRKKVITRMTNRVIKERKTILIIFIDGYILFYQIVYLNNLIHRGIGSRKKVDMVCGIVGV